MSVKGSINNPEEPLSVMEDSIHSMENPAFYDAKIKASILTTLTWYSNTPMENICVDVKHGFVSLGGTVLLAQQKMVIFEIVKKTRGVIGVINNISIATEMPPLN